MPLVKDALFVYDFLSIQPFQDGNGRLSRLLGMLLLLRRGYTWIQFVSFEHEIESRKVDYYKVLMQTQKERPGEKVNDWVTFFFDCMLNIQNQLMNKLKSKAYTATNISPKEKKILSFIENHPGSKSSEIAAKLDIPLPTIKKLLSLMVKSKMILKFCIGAGINYVAETSSPLKTGLMFQLTNKDRKKEFLLRNSSSYFKINKIILTPLFDWVKPEEWSSKLSTQGLQFKITGHNNRGGSFSRPFSIMAHSSPYHFQPVFIVHDPINIPKGVEENSLYSHDYPINIEIELLGSVPKFEFDVMFVYDEM